MVNASHAKVRGERICQRRDKSAHVQPISKIRVVAFRQVLLPNLAYHRADALAAWIAWLTAACAAGCGIRQVVRNNIARGVAKFYDALPQRIRRNGLLKWPRPWISLAFVVHEEVSLPAQEMRQ